MAITAEGSPFVLTAVGDNLADVFQGRDMNDPTPVCRYKCNMIRVVLGGSGPVTLLDRAGGRLIFNGTGNVGDELQTSFGRPEWLTGCYVLALPADSEVYLHVV